MGQSAIQDTRQLWSRLCVDKTGYSGTPDIARIFVGYVPAVERTGCVLCLVSKCPDYFILRLLLAAH